MSNDWWNVMTPDEKQHFENIALTMIRKELDEMRTGICDAKHDRLDSNLLAKAFEAAVMINEMCSAMAVQEAA